jgi:SulP family sulfate permease
MPEGGPAEGETRLSVGELLSIAALAVGSNAMAVSMAALVFSGPLSDGLQRGAASFVLTGGVTIAVIAWRSGLGTVIATTQDLPAIVLTAAGANIAASATSDPVATLVALIMVATATTGIVMLLIGRYRLSRIVRFIPTTVVAGFVAGTGWLLARGGVEVMLDRHVGLSDLTGPDWRLWVPGIVLAVVIVAGTRSPRLATRALGAAVIGAIAVFYAIVSMWSSVDAVGDGGWLIGPFDDASLWQPVLPGDLADADWNEIARNLVPIAVAVFVSVLGILLNLSGLEARSGRLDLDAELMSAGAANVVIAPLGGSIAYHMLGDTTLAQKAQITGRRAPLIIGAASVALGFFAGSAAGYIPRFVVGGMLASAGLVLLVDSLSRLYRSRHAENLVTVVILGVVIVVGMPVGVGVGIVAASLIFLYRYSRIDPVRSETTARSFTSSVERPEADTNLLSEEGESLELIRVQGYLFFGSIEALSARIRDRLDRGMLRCLILDFRHVTGVDLSAMQVLRDLEVQAADAGVTVLWSDLPPAIAASVSDSTQVFDDVDHAIEAGEEVLLGQHPAPQVALTLSHELIDQLRSVSFEAGQPIITLGETGRELYIVTEGRCGASLPGSGGTRRRLREFGTGSMFGEIGFRTGEPRTADVHAIGAVTLLAVSRDEYETLARSQPDLALQLADFLIEVANKRMIHLTTRLTSELD